MRENEKLPAESPTERLLAEIGYFRRTIDLMTLLSFIHNLMLIGMVFRDREVAEMVVDVTRALVEMLSRIG